MVVESKRDWMHMLACHTLYIITRILWPSMKVDGLKAVQRRNPARSVHVQRMIKYKALQFNCLFRLNPFLGLNIPPATVNGTDHTASIDMGLSGCLDGARNGIPHPTV